MLANGPKNTLWKTEVLAAVTWVPVERRRDSQLIRDGWLALIPHINNKYEEKSSFFCNTHFLYI